MPNAATDNEIWSLYLKALRQGLNLAPTTSILAASSARSLALNTATTLNPVPVPKALAEIHRLANPIPRWTTAYEPTLATVYTQYDSFVNGIAIPADSGGKFRAVREARRILREVKEQIAEGRGPYVMTIETDAGTSVVPRFDSSPLGWPGYSEWLETSIVAFTNGAPPAIDITVTGAAVAPKGIDAERPFVRLSTRSVVRASAPAEPFALTASITTLQLTVQSATQVSLAPGAWFLGSLLGQYKLNSDFEPTSPFSQHPIWGPDGIFALVPTVLYAGFRQEVKISFDAATFDSLRWVAEESPLTLGVGPFEFDLSAEAEARGAVIWDSAETSLRAIDLSLQGQLLGITAAAPNWPSGPL